MRWLGLALLILLSGCNTVQGRDDALFVGSQHDIEYDPPAQSHCLPDKSQCIEITGVELGRFNEIKIISEDATRYRFYMHPAWHGGEYGWIKKSAIAFPEDFKPVRDWKEQSHWALCDDSGCMTFDINQYGHFTASYTDSCSITNIEGKCPQYCPFSGAYYNPHCYDSGQVTQYRNIYQLQHKSGILTYLVDIPGQGLCWEESWYEFGSCRGPINWNDYDPKKAKDD